MLTMTADEIERSALEHALGHRFQSRAILDQALTHSSFAREAESQVPSGTASAVPGDNEQLEFLGDAVLAFVVSQELFRRFPEYAEGDLSKLRAHIVSARALIRPARNLEIGKYLRFGKGEERSGGRTKSALLVNALEALIAAIFLDAGLEKAQQFVVNTILQPALEELQKQSNSTLPVTDYKSALQEIVHASGRPQPGYSLVKEQGPEHRKVFTMEVHVPAPIGGGEAFVTRAEAGTKKRAEQGAARQAWEYLQSLQASSATDTSTSEAKPPK
jgi:ribonuclease III